MPSIYRSLAWEKMAPRPGRDLVPPLLWSLSVFLSLPGPVWLQPSPPPQASPPTEPHPCHTCRGLVDSFNKVGAPAASWEGSSYYSTGIESRELRDASLRGFKSQRGYLLVVWP